MPLKESDGTNGKKVKPDMAIHNRKEREFALSITEGFQEVPNRPVVSSTKGSQSAPYRKSVIEEAAGFPERTKAHSE